MSIVSGSESKVRVIKLEEVTFLLLIVIVSFEVLFLAEYNQLFPRRDEIIRR
ncbi:MAG TPA: hypothetical protein VKA87_03525 [Nitrososphaeraceae archaeon]|nr:hypothetical protein [Nitrososphaeraceae archaeon]